MLSYVVRRILYALPIAFGVSLVVFSLIHLAPGDPLSAVVGEADAKLIAEMRAAFGYDKPLYVQYFIWLGNVLTGEFGYSLRSGQPVLSAVLPAAANTMALGVLASLFGFTLGVV